MKREDAASRVHYLLADAAETRYRSASILHFGALVQLGAFETISNRRRRRLPLGQWWPRPPSLGHNGDQCPVPDRAMTKCGMTPIVKVLLVIGLCTSGMAMTASDCGPGLLFTDYIQLYGHYAPKWSQDGSTIVFAIGKSIYSVSPDGTDLKIIARGKGIHDASLSPSLSPDGSRIAYTNVKDSPFWRPGELDWNIKLTDLNRSFKRTRTLAKHDAIDLNPAWSPDGSRIAFVSDRDSPGHFRGYTMAANGSNLRMMTRYSAFVHAPPTWSPDGKHISFASWIYTFGENTAKLVFIGVKDNITVLSPLAWSPDSLRVAFVGWTGEKHAIYTSSVDGSGLVEVREIGDRSRNLEPLPHLN